MDTSQGGKSQSSWGFKAEAFVLVAGFYDRVKEISQTLIFQGGSQQSLKEKLKRIRLSLSFLTAMSKNGQGNMNVS